MLIRNDAAVIVAAEGATVEVLGWQPDELVGCASTSFIHPEDQPSAVAAWFDMVGEPRSTRTWRGRYRSSDGRWQWVEATNTNRLDDPDDPTVVSSIVRVTTHEVGIEEELRRRKQLLSRLSDALPVGLFQIDLDGNITFSNDRLHAIIESPPAATVTAQFAGVLDDDHELFEAALTAVLSDQMVDDVEVRLRRPSDDDEAIPRVCMVSLRSLTDDSGFVTGAIGCLSDVTDRARLRRELELRANIDGLTGCLNRSATLELLELLLRARADTLDGLAVIYVDLDDFKSVNDRYGHAAGDTVLVAAVHRMQSVLRHDDRVGRLGGDEFLVVCPNVVSESAAVELSRRVHASQQGTVRVEGTDIEVHATVGLTWTDGTTTADDLVAHADRAMYTSKAERKTKLTPAR